MDLEKFDLEPTPELPVTDNVPDVPQVTDALPETDAAGGVPDVPPVTDALPETDAGDSVPDVPPTTDAPGEAAAPLAWENAFDIPQQNPFGAAQPYVQNPPRWEGQGSAQPIGVVDAILKEAGAQPTQPRQPSPRPQSVTPAPQKKKSRGWIWLLVGLIAGLLVGFGVGFWSGRLAAHRTEKVEQPDLSIPEETVADAPNDPEETLEDAVSGQIQQAGEAAIATLPSEVYKNNVASVVGVLSEGSATNHWGETAETASFGTGFIISSDGYLLTNYHVVQGGSKVTVMLYDGRELPATVVGYDGGICDVALLKVEADGLQAVTFGSSDDLIVGEQVCAIGNPLGELTYSLTVGYVSAKDRLISTDGTPINMLQTDCTINSGNSGGPLFDMHGNVIGITTAKYSGTTSSGTTVEGIGFAIPIDDVIVLLDDLQTYGRVTTQPYLGVTVRISAPVGDYPAGAYINDVVEGGAAFLAGMQGGDLITRIGDYPVNSYNGLVSALRHYHAGDTVEIDVWRAGETLTLHLTFDSRPSQEPAQSTEPEPTEPSSPFGWGFP